MGNATTRVKSAAFHLDEVADQLKKDAEWAKSESLKDLLTFYVELKEGYAALDTARKRIYNLLDLLNKAVVPEALEASGMDKVRVPELACSFYVLPRYSASLLDKEAGFDWLREVGLEDLITETVNAGTLAAAMKELVLEHGIDPPEDIVKFSTYNTTGVSKYTPK
jgi:hypothetical protein